MKILIIRFSSIGDIVLTTPVVRCLKMQLHAEIHYLTKRGFEKILTANPNIDRVFTIEKKVSEVINNLKSVHYDYVIDLHNNLRSWQVRRALKVKSFNFNKLNVEKWLMVNCKINRLPHVHIVDRYLAATKTLGIKNDNKGLDYFIPAQDEVSIPDLIPNLAHNVQNPAKYIAFVIGAAHATKRLPTDRIVEICDKIQYPVVLLGGKDDMGVADIIVSQSKRYIINTCGKMNLNQSASIVKQAFKVITHDTGLMHIAAAFKKDILSVWGNTIPAFGMTPYVPTEGSKIFEVKSLSCRPCSKIGHTQCPKGHFNCMNQQNANDIAEAANSIF